MSVFQLAEVVLRHRRLIVGLPILFAAVAIAVTLIVRPRYTATTAFLPENESSGLNLPMGLAGVAAEFGVGLPGASNPARFYADVLESNTIRDRLLEMRFADPSTSLAGDSATLLDLLEIEGDNHTERLEVGRRALERAVTVGVSAATNVVTVAVETHFPGLSADVANRSVELINAFNMGTRQTAGRQRREFAEARVDAAEGELRAAEDDLLAFLQSNRMFEQSPELTFEHERLQRQVRMKEEIVTTLRREYEEARIQEVNDTPLLTIIDRAMPPDEKSSPKRRLTAVVAVLLGGLAGLFAAFTLDYLNRAREANPEQYERLTRRVKHPPDEA